MLGGMPLKTYLQPYYVANGLVCVAWLPLRYVLPETWRVCEPGSGSFLMTREKEVFALIGFAVMGKLRRATSSHEFLSKVFLYGKTALGLLLFMTFWPGLAVAFAAFMTLALVPAPVFPGADKVEILDGDAFARRCCRPPPEEDRMAPVFVVAFVASWCDACTHADPLFCSLAAEHASVRRKFVSVDVATFAHLAKRFDIDVSVRTRQLPTFALFYGGKLQRRLPYFDRAKLPDKKVVVKTRFTRESLAKYFLLDLAVKDAVAKLKKIDEHRGEDAAERKAD